MNFNLTEPNPGDKISANLIREIIRAIRALTPISGHRMKTRTGPNGTVFNVDDDDKRRNGTVLPWTFSCTVGENGDGEETRTGGWSNCRMQIGYDASFGDSAGQHRDLCKDGLYYAEVDLLTKTWDLKVIEQEEGESFPGTTSIPPHDFQNNRVNVFIGTVRNAVCTYSIHCIPVVYMYV